MTIYEKEKRPERKYFKSFSFISLCEAVSVVKESNEKKQVSQMDGIDDIFGGRLGCGKNAITICNQQEINL